ncbi:MAG: glycosyltransferase family 2 protein [Mariniphaga sp.]|nr:glycosyltransferase family 2 protein [Mariniphaga sp.]
MMNKKISLILLTYNRPDALALVLLSIKNQTVLPDEVIIADDGSTPETSTKIKSWQTTFPVPLLHVWHEDRGYRISSIRNKAVKICNGNVLVFSDGDLFFHPKAIEDYKRKIKPGEALIGSRVFLTRKATQNRITNRKFNPVFPFFSPEIELNRLNSIRIPLLYFFLKPLQFSKHLRGGLLCLWKDELVAVNGWNEEFSGWGLEDTELVFRLFNHGTLFRKVKFQALTYHLWHKVQARDQISKNKELLEHTMQSNITRCKKGLELLD